VKDILDEQIATNWHKGSLSPCGSSRASGSNERGIG
jgi:hypothetical protein